MKKVYFDDLFLVLDNEGFTLCLYNPYEQYTRLLWIGKISCNLDDSNTPERFVYSIINSEAFKNLNINVLGIPHKLAKG